GSDISEGVGGPLDYATLDVCKANTLARLGCRVVRGSSATIKPCRETPYNLALTGRRRRASGRRPRETRAKRRILEHFQRRSRAQSCALAVSRGMGRRSVHAGHGTRPICPLAGFV